MFVILLMMLKVMANSVKIHSAHSSYGTSIYLNQTQTIHLAVSDFHPISVIRVPVNKDTEIRVNWPAIYPIDVSLVLEDMLVITTTFTGIMAPGAVDSKRVYIDVVMDPTIHGVPLSLRSVAVACLVNLTLGIVLIPRIPFIKLHMD